MLLDFTGGSLSLLQMFLLAYNNGKNILVILFEYFRSIEILVVGNSFPDIYCQDLYHLDLYCSDLYHLDLHCLDLYHPDLRCSDLYFPEFLLSGPSLMTAAFMSAKLFLSNRMFDDCFLITFNNNITILALTKLHSVLK